MFRILREHALRISAATLILCAVSACGGGNATTASSGASGAGSAVSDKAPTKLTVEGRILGLAKAGLVLQLNGAHDLALTDTANSFQFANLVEIGSTYTVNIKAQPVTQTCTVLDGNGKAEATVSKVLVKCDSLAPATINVTNHDGSVDISWPDIVGATTYKVYYGRSKPLTAENSTVHISSTPSLTLTLENETTYYVSVSMLVGDVESALSEPVEAHPISRLPGVPVLSTKADGRDLVASWTPVARASGYKLYYSQNTPVTTADTRVETTATSFRLPNRSNAKPTYFAVLATVNGEDGALSPSLPATAQPSPIESTATGKMPDTGQTLCYTKLGSNEIGPCGTEPELGVQDGDVIGARNYKKISNYGQILDDDAVLGYGPDDWACTLDLTTGLIWEVKTSDGGLRDKSHKYTNPSEARADDVRGFIDAVNDTALCGYTDWRMPRRTEMSSILDLSRSNPVIDIKYFGETTLGWTRSLSEAKFSLENGEIYFGGPLEHLAVRLVRATKSTIKPLFISGDAEVTDPVNKLVWQQCAVGMHYDRGNNRCTGTATLMTHEDALRHAKAANENKGLQGWRLPTLNELVTLLELNLVAKTNLFPNMPRSYYWTSSLEAGSIDRAEKVSVVHFNYNGTGHIPRKREAVVRLVRSVE